MAGERAGPRLSPVRLDVTANFETRMAAISKQLGFQRRLPIAALEVSIIRLHRPGNLTAASRVSRYRPTDIIVNDNDNEPSLDRGHGAVSLFLRASSLLRP